MSRHINESVVLITDPIVRARAPININATDLEKTEEKYFLHLKALFQEKFINVTTYSSPENFINSIEKHKNDIVFSCWHGECSRNRLSLVSSICESYGIRYVGADAYAKFICQDKVLAKDFVRSCGLSVAEGVMICDESEVDAIELVQLPHVIKPSREGTSVGISDKSISHNIDNTKKLTLDLLRSFKQPIIVEEFLGGRECLICIVGQAGEIRLFGAAELLVDGSNKYFEDNLFGFELKKQSKGRLSYRPITPEISEEDRVSCIKLFNRLGKMDCLRIDTRLCDGKLKLIELSPIPYLSEFSAFSCVFKECSLSLQDGVELIFQTTIDGYRQRETNGLER